MQHMKIYFLKVVLSVASFMKRCPTIERLHKEDVMIRFQLLSEFSRVDVCYCFLVDLIMLL